MKFFYLEPFIFLKWKKFLSRSRSLKVICCVLILFVAKVLKSQRNWTEKLMLDINQIARLILMFLDYKCISIERFFFSRKFLVWNYILYPSERNDFFRFLFFYVSHFLLLHNATILASYRFPLIQDLSRHFLEHFSAFLWSFNRL